MPCRATRGHRLTSVLLTLLRAYLRPYRRPVALVVLFQLVSTIASLYLPGLNAQIIDLGVVTGDTGYIVRTGGVMLRRDARPDRVLRRRGLLRRPHRDGAGQGPARVGLRHGRVLRRPGGRPVRRAVADHPTTNDVQQVQMLVLMTFTMMVAAPIMCVGGIIMALRQDVPLSSLLVVVVPVLLVCVGLIVSRMRPLFRSMQEQASTWSTGSCASRSAASASSGPSSGTPTNSSGSTAPTPS